MADATTVSANIEDIMETIRKWFNTEVLNWYDEHVPESDPIGPDYLYMDEYESDVNFEQPDKLCFYGYCTGHYEDEIDDYDDDDNEDSNEEHDDYDDDDYDEEDLTANFYFELERMEETLEECGIKVGEQVTLSEDKDRNEIVVTLKTLTLEEFAEQL